MSDLGDKVTDAAARLGESASGLAEDVQDRARDAFHAVEYSTKRAVRQGSAYVRKNPVPTALGAFALGLVLGLLLSRRQAATFSTT